MEEKKKPDIQKNVVDEKALDEMILIELSEILPTEVYEVKEE